MAWYKMGRKVTDSSVEYDWSTETSTDILGNNYSTAKKPTMTQTFSGEQIVAGDKVMGHLLKISIINQDVASLTAQDLLIVHQYLQDNEGNPFVERYPQSTVVPTTNGGEGGGQIVTDIEVSYGGERQIGTISVDETSGETVFTADATEKTYSIVSSAREHLITFIDVA